MRVAVTAFWEARHFRLQYLISLEVAADPYTGHDWNVYFGQMLWGHV